MCKSNTRPICKACIGLISIYRLCISPWLRPSCRYSPTCSEYAITAFNTHGTLRGCWLTLKRICRCNPFGGSGYDPVPKSYNLKEEV
jgi:putative membrane protein insertion efficiency factor